MRVFIDSNVILDLLLERQPFFPDSVEIFNEAAEGKVNLICSPLIFSNLFYIIRKATNSQTAFKSLRQLKAIVDIINIGSKTIELALNSEFNDFEDAIQYFAALDAKASCLITRNKKDYKEKQIPILLPKEYISLYKQKKK